MISLVVATIGRTEELQHLLVSLDAQSHRAFEVLIIDQNPDDRLVPVLRQHGSLDIVHLRCSPGLSKARNVGLRAVRGDMVAFPDDDCWYPPDLLEKVEARLAANSGNDIFLAGMRNEFGKPMTPKFAPKAGRCTLRNVWDCAAAATLFCRREVINMVGSFNEELGVGPDTAFKACEEIEYCIRALRAGFNAWYDPSLHVYHAELGTIERMRRTTYPYACAYGYVLRTGGYSPWYFLRRVSRSLAGCAGNLGLLRFARSRLYLLRAAGQLHGYFWGPRDMAHKERRLS